jgi:uncharacterized protein YoxC
MEQINTALNGSINIIVVFTLLLLALSLTFMMFAVSSIVPHIKGTLDAITKLSTTVEAELEPTLEEANKLLGGVLKLQNIAQTGVVGVQNKVEDVTGNITKVAHEAKRESSVWSVGLAAGVRAFLDHKPDPKTGKDSEDRKTNMDRGEKNVGHNR